MFMARRAALKTPQARVLEWEQGEASGVRSRSSLIASLPHASWDSNVRDAGLLHGLWLASASSHSSLDQGLDMFGASTMSVLSLSLVPYALE